MLRYTIGTANAASRRRHAVIRLSGTGINSLFVPSCAHVPVVWSSSSSLSEEPKHESDTTTARAAASPHGRFIHEWREAMTSLESSDGLRAMPAHRNSMPKVLSPPVYKPTPAAPSSFRKANAPMSSLFEKRIRTQANEQTRTDERTRPQQITRSQPGFGLPQPNGQGASPPSSVRSWRERLQSHTVNTTADVGIHQANHRPLSSPSSSKSSPSRSWRNTLSNLSPDRPAIAPIADMRDVSLLRAAFLKCAKQNSSKAMSLAEAAAEVTAAASANPGLYSSPSRTADAWRSQANRSTPLEQSVTYPGRARELRAQMMRQNFERQQQEIQWERNRERPRMYSDPKPLNIGNKLPAKKKREKRRFGQREREANDTHVILPAAPVSVTALSSIFRIKIDRIMQKLRECGERPTDDEYIVDVDTMEIVALDLGLEPVRSNRRVLTSVSEENRDLLMQRRVDDDVDEGTAVSTLHSSLPLRPPVVCLLGHVDHGKTTLMDALRRKNAQNGATVEVKKKKKAKNKADESGKKSSDDVAGTEAGGITQVISAFQVSLANQDDSIGAVTFLDTPGHAAFRAMRESGSHAADVIVLVVAADDGVSKQTIEILDFYKSIYKESAGISLVVAMTKIDKPGILIDESRFRIENELMEQGIVTESFASTSVSEYGPAVQLVPVSGLTGDGLDELIDALVLQSEVMELRADPDAHAEGIVLDARIEKGIGVVADCIIRWGSMQCGDVVLSGVHSGKVKALKNGMYLFLLRWVLSGPHIALTTALSAVQFLAEI